MIFEMPFLYKDLSAEVTGSRAVVVLLVFEHGPDRFAESVAFVALHLPLDAVHGVEVTRVVECTLRYRAAYLTSHRRFLSLLSYLLSQYFLSVDLNLLAFKDLVFVVVAFDAVLLLDFSSLLLIY